MKGIGKRVTVAFLSIVASLSVSGVISLFELSNLSYDTETILSASNREMEIAKNMLQLAHDHSRAMVDVTIFDKESKKDLCHQILSKLDSRIVEIYRQAPEAVKGSLDTLAIYSEELRRLTNNYHPGEMVKMDSLTMTPCQVDGREWYAKVYEPTYNLFTEQIRHYTTLAHDQLEPRVEQLSKNAYRAVAPVLISLLVMIAIVLMFYYFIYVYGVKPILCINRSLSDYLSFKLPYKAKAEMIDEIKELNNNVENLVNIARSNKKQEGDAI